MIPKLEHLTRERHRFEMCGTTYTRIFFFKDFIFKSFLHSMWGSNSLSQNQESHALLSQRSTPTWIFFNTDSTVNASSLTIFLTLSLL